MVEADSTPIAEYSHFAEGLKILVSGVQISVLAFKISL